MLTDVQVPYLETGQQCRINSECNSNEICGKDSGRCDECESDKCYEKLENKKMYKLDKPNSSYIEVKNVDQFNMSFKFSIIASKSNYNQMIVMYGSKLWYIYIDDDGDMFKLNNDISLEPKLTDVDEIYTFKITVYLSEIDININGTSNKYDLEYNSPSTSSSAPKSNDILYFGGNPLGHDQYYFDGYIGGFTFYNDIYEMCKFKYETGIKSNCEYECNKDCSKEDCEAECKDAPPCNFDSSKHRSRHAIECMTKCINPKNECDVNYCKKQCWECGADCYWIKHSKYSVDDDGNGTLPPPKISLHSTSYDGTKAKIMWEPIKGSHGYVSIAYKTKKKKEGFKIDKINNGLCSKSCEYIISDLIPEEDYSLVVKAYNKKGIGKSSNLLSFKTIKKIINTNVLNKIDDASQYEVGNYSNDNIC